MDDANFMSLLIIGDPHFDRAPVPRAADRHPDVVFRDHDHRVAIRMHDVLVWNTVTAGRAEDANGWRRAVHNRANVGTTAKAHQGIFERP